MHHFQILLKNSQNLARLLAHKVKKWHIFWDVQVEKLARLGTLARKNEMGRFWHVGKWARGYVNHGATHDTHGTRFSKLVHGHTSTKFLNAGCGGYLIISHKIYC